MFAVTYPAVFPPDITGSLNCSNYHFSVFLSYLGKPACLEVIESGAKKKIQKRSRSFKYNLKNCKLTEI